MDVAGPDDARDLIPRQGTQNLDAIICEQRVKYRPRLVEKIHD